MRESLALLRAAWLTESSYRLNMGFSLASLAFIVVPLFFVTKALQPMMATSISTQSPQYFAFALVGAMTLTVISASASALPSALASAIGRGTLEAFLATPTNPLVLFTGMSAYGILWALLRAAVMLAAGMVLGVHVAWANTLTIALIVVLLIAVHAAIGLAASSMLLCFRTTGPLITGMLAVSALLGGAYYPTHVIPSWLQELSTWLPITYGLRALRQAALLNEPFSAVAADVGILAAFTVVLLVAGALTLRAALGHARRTGSLSHY